VQKGRTATGKRSTRPAARTKFVVFAPNGREWAAATTVGVLVHSLDGAAANFRPVKLTYELTPQRVYQTLKEGNYAEAMLQALQLNDDDVLRSVFYGVAGNMIDFTSAQIPAGNLGQMLELVAAEMLRGKHFEFCLRWTLALMLKHALTIERVGLVPQLREIARAISDKSTDLKRIGDQNKYTMQYLQSMASQKRRLEVIKEEDEAEEKKRKLEEQAKVAQESGDKAVAAEAKPGKAKKKLKKTVSEEKAEQNGTTNTTDIDARPIKKRKGLKRKAAT
jgi:hypothetical protein